MKDLIERNKAIDVAKKLLDDYGTNAITKEFADDVAEIYINKVPSAQPEIIRCKDCVCSHDEVWLFGNGGATAYGYCGRTYLQVLPNDFCSKAERREE